jgi:hypothetical protein
LHTTQKILSFTFVCLGTCHARTTLPACTRISVVGALPDAIVPRSSLITPEHAGISIVVALPYAVVSRSRSDEILDLIPLALRAVSIFLRRYISDNHP